MGQSRTVAQRARTHPNVLERTGTAPISALSITAIAVWLPGLTGAQTAPSQPSAPVPQPTLALEPITVTATRLQISGLAIPTPVTEINLQDIQSQGLPNVADYLNAQIPGFVAANTPTSQSFYVGANGINTLDLRGLGPQDTLVLVDGERVVPTTPSGQVNLNTIPQALIKSVEIVKGGASADWGSDAVAGVVNIILDDGLKGLRISTQYGESTKRDAKDQSASIAYGFDIGGSSRHLVIGADYQKDDGLPSQTDRALGREGWAYVPNPAYTGQSGVPQDLIVSHAGVIFQQGGVVFGPGPIAGTAFGPGGAVMPLNTGQYIAGGEWIVGGGGALLDSALIPATERKSVMALFRQDFSGGAQLYFKGSYAISTAASTIAPPFALPATIQSGNPYIPASFQDELTANDISSFGLYRGDADLGFVTSTERDSTYSTTLGIKGPLGSKWSWDIYAEDGSLLDHVSQTDLLNQNFAFATDAVTDPSTGQPVCAATLQGNPAARGCVPIDLFGVGSPSAGAINYVMGTGFGDTSLDLQAESAVLRGQAWQGWGGPVQIALGVEHRTQHVRATADANDEQGNFLIHDFQPIEGQISVTEGFLETGVPLLKDRPLAKSLDLNAAARVSDYSTSGRVVTWKAGLTYSPVSDILLRGVVSRDIRAPNVSELYTPQSLQYVTLNDPFTGASNLLVKDYLSGNAALQPESAITTTFGIVFVPSFAPGLRASIDAYDIKLHQEIENLDSQLALNQCYAGETSECAFFTRVDGQLVAVNSPDENIGQSEFSGADFDIAYHLPLQALRSNWPGMLTLRLLANYIDKVDISTTGGAEVNYVESLAIDVSNPYLPLLPRWMGNATLAYGIGQFTATTSVRVVGSGFYQDYGNGAGLSAAQNLVSARTYVNLSFDYDFDVGESTLSAYLGINNAFDTVAPPLPYNFIVQQPNTGELYDNVGRYVYAGLRLRTP